MKNFNKFIYSFTITAITLYLGRHFTQLGLVAWYNQTPHPTITPPAYIFPIVWSLLYFLMALSFYLVLVHAPKNNAKIANRFYVGQLFLQILWTFLFFQQGHIALAFGIIILLDVVVYKMIISFKKINIPAAYLLYPYFWWLCFASFLNFSFIYNNGMIVVF